MIDPETLAKPEMHLIFEITFGSKFAQAISFLKKTSQFLTCARYLLPNLATVTKETKTHTIHPFHPLSNTACLWGSKFSFVVLTPWCIQFHSCIELYHKRIFVLNVQKCTSFRFVLQAIIHRVKFQHFLVQLIRNESQSQTTWSVEFLAVDVERVYSRALELFNG